MQDSLGLIPGLGRSPGEGNGYLLLPGVVFLPGVEFYGQLGRLQSLGLQRVEHN